MPMLKETMLKRLLLPIAAAGGGGSATVQETATGNPLTFLTDLARPLKSLLIPFTPQQSGTGDPSPENIRPIVPWDGLTVWNGGKNLLPNTEVKAEGNQFFLCAASSVYPFNLKAGTYTLSSTGKTAFAYYKKQGGSGVLIHGNTVNYGTFTITDDGNYQIWYYTSGATAEDFTDVQLEVGSRATTYEAPTITETDISFPSPVYGGEHEAVSGRLENGWWSLDVAWSDRWYGQQLTNVERRVFLLPTGIIPKAESYYNDHRAEILCNTAKWTWSFNDDSVHFYVEKNSGKYIAIVFLPIGTPEDTRIQIVGTLATPQEITLSPQQITALVGDNTIWSDADGSMTAVYLKKG